VNPRAIKIMARVHLGYVPDPLFGYVGAVLDGTPDAKLVMQPNRGTPTRTFVDSFGGKSFLRRASRSMDPTGGRLPEQW